MYFGLLAGGKTPDVGSRTFTDIMREQQLKGEESEVSFNAELFIDSSLNNIPSPSLFTAPKKDPREGERWHAGREQQ